MKLALQILIYFVTIVVLAGCSHSDPALQNADKLIMSNPEGALALLKSINKNNLSSADLPLYSLLYTEAELRNDVCVTSDSLILAAKEKYVDEDQLGYRTEWCVAKISLQNKEYQQAMKSAMRAYYIAEKLGDRNAMGSACNLIGKVLFNTNNNQQAAQYIRQSIIHYKTVGDIVSERYATANLARVYINKGNSNKAVVLLDSIINEISKDNKGGVALRSYIESPRLVARANIDTTTRLTAEEIDLISKDKSEYSLEKNLLTMIWRNANKSECFKIDSLICKIKREANADEERGWGMYAMYTEARKEKNDKNALLLADSLLKLQNSIYTNLLEESVIGVQRDFIDGKLLVEKHSSRHKNWIIAGIIFIAVVIIMLTVFIARLRGGLREKNLELILVELNDLRTRAADAAAASSKNTKTGLSENNGAVGINRSSTDTALLEIIQHLFTSKWQTINALCDDYMANRGVEGVDGAVFKQIEREIKKLQSQTTFDNLEKAVNAFKNGAMTRCCEQLPDLKNAEYNMLTLLMLGMSPRTISLFLNIQPQNFYQRRSRLRAKIAGYHHVASINDYLSLLQ